MQNINKQDALKRLASIEQETKELRKIIDAKSDWTSIVDFESACQWLGRDANEKLDKWKHADLTSAQISGLILETCIEAVNTTDGKRWELNWLDKGQKKWYNWLEKGSSGYAVGVSYLYDGAHVGSGFYFESEEKTKHGRKYFLQYYQVWLG